MAATALHLAGEDDEEGRRQGRVAVHRGDEVGEKKKEKGKARELGGLWSPPPGGRTTGREVVESAPALHLASEDEGQRPRSGKEGVWEGQVEATKEKLMEWEKDFRRQRFGMRCYRCWDAAEPLGVRKGTQAGRPSQSANTRVRP